jgi:hypothetical protein
MKELSSFHGVYFNQSLSYCEADLTSAPAQDCQSSLGPSFPLIDATGIYSVALRALGDPGLAAAQYRLTVRRYADHNMLDLEAALLKPAADQFVGLANNFSENMGGVRNRLLSLLSSTAFMRTKETPPAASR